MDRLETKKLAEAWIETERRNFAPLSGAALARQYLALEARCDALEAALKLRPMSEVPRDGFAVLFRQNFWICQRNAATKLWKYGRNDRGVLEADSAFDGWLDLRAIAQVLAK